MVASSAPHAQGARDSRSARVVALNALLEQESGARARFAKNRRASNICGK